MATFILRDNILYGKQARLSELQARILVELAKNPGRVISKERFIHSMYWDALDADLPESADAVMKVTIHNLRATLAKLTGLNPMVVIETEYSVGYKLNLPIGVEGYENKLPPAESLG